MQIYGDHGGECRRMLETIAGVVHDRTKALEEWEKEEKQPTADEAVKAMITEGSKPKWKNGDQRFVKLLVDKSMKTAAECNERGEHSLKDIFLAQAARLEQELKQLISLYGPYKEPVTASAPKPKKRRRKKKR